MSWYMEWIGYIIGALGALMLTTNTLISVMTGTSLLGVYRWLYSPAPNFRARKQVSQC